MSFCVEVGDDQVPLIQLGDYQLRLELEDLHGHFKDRAVKELRESPENTEKSLKKIRELIKDEQDLILPVEDERFLLKFLRPCKYYPESAFKLLKKFYKFKVKHPNVGLDLTPNNVRHVFDNEVFVFLPTRSRDGSRLMIINVGTKWNPKLVSLQDLFRAVMVSIEIAMMEPKTQVGGVHVIINFQGLTLMHAYQFSPIMAKMIVDWVQECTPVRLKGIHIINQSFLFNMIYSLFKPFLGDKLKKRIFFHGSNRQGLCDAISAESLPKYLGGAGNIPEYPGRLFSEMLFHYDETFKLHNTFGYPREKAAID